MISYKDILDDINTIVTDHLELRRFIRGPVSEIDINKLAQDEFPFCYTECTSVDLDGGSLTYTLDVIVAQLINDDLTDRTDAYDSTLLILKDVLHVILHSQYGRSIAAKIQNRIDLNLPVTITPFTARFDNDLTGWQASIDITVDNENNLCISPFA